jgi:hypothetical protein
MTLNTRVRLCAPLSLLYTQSGVASSATWTSHHDLASHTCFRILDYLTPFPVIKGVESGFFCPVFMSCEFTQKLFHVMT